MGDPNVGYVSADCDSNKPPNSIIDDDAVSFILRAIQGYDNSKTLSAPKVTVLDGESASISITAPIAYIADYNMPKAKGLFTWFAKPKPIVKTIEKGIKLKVLPTLLSDGEKILLDIDLEYVTEVSLEDFTYKEKYPFQRPVTEKLVIDSEVTVPDGGTLVISGYEGIPITIKDKAGQKRKGSLLVLIKAKVVDGS